MVSIRGILLSVASLAFRTNAFVTPLPGPPGPCNVQVHTAMLTDTSRIDPFDPTHRKRSVMISTYSPTQCGGVQLSSYFPALTAQFEDEEFQAFGIDNGTFESLKSSSCSSTGTDPGSHRSREFPLVIFSPAVATSRLIYTILLQDLASRGYAIASVDHPYDADIVEFPDGSVIYGTLANISTEAEVDPDLNVRVGDVRFVLDTLHQSPNATSLFPSLYRSGGGLRLDQVISFGHSLGGATAAEAMLVDNRFIGGINLDGALWGNVTQTGLSLPFLIFAHTNHTLQSDPTWASFLSNSSGWKLVLELANSQHYSFSDYPTIVDSLDVSPVVKEVIQANRIGTIGALRARNVINEYVTAAFTYFISKKSPQRLRGPSNGYSDVSFKYTRND